MLDEFNSVKQRAPFQWVIHEGFDQQHLPIKPRGAPVPDGAAAKGFVALDQQLLSDISHLLPR